MARRPNPRRELPARAEKGQYQEHHNHNHGDDEGESKGERQIFVDLVQRRLGGGATPTAEAYAKAMQQWQGLAGAVQFVAVPAFPKPVSGATSTLANPPEMLKDDPV